jgi:hypothetical protein
MVQDTSAKVLENLFALIKCCGELALSNEICPTVSLMDTDENAYDATQKQVAIKEPPFSFYPV